MIMVAIFIFVFIIAFFVLAGMGEDDGILLTSAVVAAFGLIVIGWPIKAYADHIDPPTYDHFTKEIAMVSDGTNINGRFSLFSGYLNEDQIFAYYEIQDGGYHTLKKTDAANVRVYEDAERPYVKYLGHCDTGHEWIWSCNNEGYGNVVEFHVPKNSISQEIVLDAK